jgi:hypothetical protein
MEVLDLCGACRMQGPGRQQDAERRFNFTPREDKATDFSDQDQTYKAGASIALASLLNRKAGAEECIGTE